MDRRKADLLNKLEQLNREIEIAIEVSLFLKEDSQCMVRKIIEDNDARTFLHNFPTINLEIDKRLNQLVNYNCFFEDYFGNTCIQNNCASERCSTDRLNNGSPVPARKCQVQDSAGTGIRPSLVQHAIVTSDTLSIRRSALPGTNCVVDKTSLVHSTRSTPEIPDQVTTSGSPASPGTLRFVVTETSPEAHEKPKQVDTSLSPASHERPELAAKSVSSGIHEKPVQINKSLSPASTERPELVAPSVNPEIHDRSKQVGTSSSSTRPELDTTSTSPEIHDGPKQVDMRSSSDSLEKPELVATSTRQAIPKELEKFSMSASQVSFEKPALVASPAELQVADTAEMYYLNGDSPWHFWLRYPVSSGASDLMSAKHAAGQLILFGRPCVGDLVCCLHNSRYMRGRVENVQAASITMLDLDVGEKYKLETNTLWYVDSELNMLRHDAIQCRLHAQLGDKDSVWFDSYISLFKEALVDCPLSITVWDKVTDGTLNLYSVEIHSNSRGNQSYNKFEFVMNTLIPNLGKATVDCKIGGTSDSNERKVKLLHCKDVKRKRETHLINCEKKMGLPTVLSEEEESRSTLKLAACPERQQVNKFQENISQIAIVDSCIGMLSHIVNPTEFYFHVASEENSSLDKFHTNVNKYYKTRSNIIDFQSKDEAQKKIGHFCACYYSEECEGWYRGQILDWKMKQNKISVQLLDYGDKFQTTLNNIQPLFEDFVHQPLYATRCHLAAVKPPKGRSTWPQESVRVFQRCFDMSKAYEISATSWDVDPPYTTTPVSSSLNHSKSLPILLIDSNRAAPRIINDFLVDLDFAEVDLKSPSLKMLEQSFTEQQQVAFEEDLFHEEPDSVVKVENWFQQRPTKPVKKTKTKKIVDDPTDGLSFTSSLAYQKDSLPVDLDAWNPMEEDFEDRERDDENACVAVSGYEATDEQRVCRFFARDGHCYKGDRCRKEHSFLNPDGYTTDKEAVMTSAYNQLTIPAAGSQIHVEVTYVPIKKFFYAVIYPNLRSQDQQLLETLSTLSLAMNNPNCVRKYKRLKITPAKGQMVVAQFTTDKKWYRARVVETNNDHEELDVFFVDYGNVESVHESKIRDIEPRFLHLPFQAVECTLANVDLTDADLSLAAELFNKLVAGKTLVAWVVQDVDIIGQMQCVLYDYDGSDIGLAMVANGMGAARDQKDMPRFKENGLIPG